MIKETLRGMTGVIGETSGVGAFRWNEQVTRLREQALTERGFRPEPQPLTELSAGLVYTIGHFIFPLTTREFRIWVNRENNTTPTDESWFRSQIRGVAAGTFDIATLCFMYGGSLYFNQNNWHLGILELTALKPLANLAVYSSLLTIGASYCFLKSGVQNFKKIPSDNNLF